MADELKVTDIYVGSSDPTNNINPRIKGALYINNTLGETWVCIDNTKDNNQWILSLIQDRLYDLGTVSGTFDLNFNNYNRWNNFTIRLSGSTRFGTVTASGAKERSGYIRILSGGNYLTSFFSNAIYSFTVPFNYHAQNTSSGNEVFLFYKIFPDGKVLFTKG